jgi:hypothetical protein
VLSRIPSGGDTLKGRGSGSYKTVKELLRDVNLVWTNCLAYNCQPQDEPTRKLCDTIRKTFESKWQAAGLPLVPEEKQTPPDKKDEKLAGADLPPANTVDIPDTHYMSPGSDQVQRPFNGLFHCQALPRSYSVVKFASLESRGWGRSTSDMIALMNGCNLE